MGEDTGGHEMTDKRKDCDNCKYDYPPNYRLCIGKYKNMDHPCFVEYKRMDSKAVSSYQYIPVSGEATK